MAETGMAYVLTPRGILKIVETVLIVISMGMWFGLFQGYTLFISGTVLAAMYTTIAFGAQNALLGPSRVAELLLYGVSSLFLIICSIILFVNVQTSLGTATGVFFILTGIVYAVDTFFTLRVTDDPAS